MERIPEVELLAAGVLGYVLQWARSRKDIANWVTWVAVAVLAAALWFWMTPAGVAAFQTDWRKALVSVVMFVLSSQGAARASADSKAAPKTDSK